jgi:hypothetical protein
VILVMTGFMLGMTISTVVNYRFSDLPFKWWLIILSSAAVGSGLWAVRTGPIRSIRFWCGVLWTLYAVVRSASWLSRGSWSGALPWVPCLLLGLVVFARRNSAPYVRDGDDEST